MSDLRSLLKHLVFFAAPVPAIVALLDFGFIKRFYRQLLLEIDCAAIGLAADQAHFADIFDPPNVNGHNASRPSHPSP